MNEMKSVIAVEGLYNREEAVNLYNRIFSDKNFESIYEPPTVGQNQGIYSFLLDRKKAEIFKKELDRQNVKNSMI